MANLLSELAAALADGGIETVPDDWKTARELVRESGYGPSRAGEIIREALNAGLLESRAFRIRSGQRVHPVPHYRRVK